MTTNLENIIEFAKTGKHMAIRAAAGTGKTFCLKALSKEYRKNSLYICFNKSVQLEAEKEFPSHVECRTLNSIAYREMEVYNNPGRLSGWLVGKDVRNFYQGSFENVQLIIECIKTFCQSDDLYCEEFFLYFLKKHEKSGYTYSEKVYRAALGYWVDLINPKGISKISHDIYLKQFQLSGINLNYELILVDEAQDFSPVNIGILRNQKGAQIILVGDENQAIYAFRGAENAFDYFSKLDTFYLLDSYRFNPEIATKANIILELLGSDLRMEGLNRQTEIKTSAILVRKNITLFKYLLEAYQNEEKVYILGDLGELYKRLYSASNLKYNGDISKRYDAYIKTFDSWEEFCSVKNGEHNLIQSILETFPNIHDIITKIKTVIVKDVEDAARTVATVHKAKGLEWDEVTISDDFNITEQLSGDVSTTRQEVMNIFQENQFGNLLYVAITRGRVKVNIDLDEFLGV